VKRLATTYIDLSEADNLAKDDPFLVLPQATIMLPSVNLDAEHPLFRHDG
jgi:hypothetical protein